MYSLFTAFVRCAARDVVTHDEHAGARTLSKKNNADPRACADPRAYNRCAPSKPRTLGTLRRAGC